MGLLRDATAAWAANADEFGFLATLSTTHAETERQRSATAVCSNLRASVRVHTIADVFAFRGAFLELLSFLSTSPATGTYGFQNSEGQQKLFQ